MNTMELYTHLLDFSKLAPDGKPFDLTGAAQYLPDKALARALTAEMPRAVPFDFTNVTTMLDERIAPMTESDIMDFIRDVPPCLPPYESMFVEVPAPERGDDGYRLGGLIVSRKLKTQFFTVLYGYMRTPYGVFGPLSGARILFNNDGTAKADSVTRRVFEPHTLESNLAIADYLTAVVLFGCALTHCKNVGERHANLPRPYARMRERRHQPPIVWKTLVIEPLAKPQTPSQVAEALDSRNHRRVHLCRGHFAEYGPEFQHADGTPKGKLFGRIEGRFWVPAVVKGSADVGVIVKDYKIGATKP